MTQLGYITSEAAMQARLNNILPNPDYHTLVAEVDNRVAGMVGCFVGYTHEIDGFYGYIIAMVVGEGYRGKGVGAALVREAEKWFRERQAVGIILTSNKRRLDAHAFYERLGYESTGLRFSKRLAG
jgi:GNAT superfamily N-acetyltransferase